jgi:hypothetical protein
MMYKYFLDSKDQIGFNPFHPGHAVRDPRFAFRLLFNLPRKAKQIISSTTQDAAVEGQSSHRDQDQNAPFFFHVSL